MGSIERRNEHDIDVFLSEKMYNPGDKIQGQIQFHLNRKLFCDTIIAQLYGIAKVFWTTNEVYCYIFIIGFIIVDYKFLRNV